MVRLARPREDLGIGGGAGGGELGPRGRDDASIAGSTDQGTDVMMMSSCAHRAWKAFSRSAGATDLWHNWPMWRLLSGCLLVTGCLKTNPAWEEAAGSSSSTAAPASTSSASSTGAAPTSSGDASTGTGTGSGEGSTGAPVATTSEGSSTGAPPVECMAVETIALKTGVEDAGVVQDLDAEPCPWSTEFNSCPPLNFGHTEFYRLINDEDDGRNAALLRFPVTSLEPLLADLGHQPEDLLGLRIELVVWEEEPAPAGPYALEIHGLDPANYGWTEGTKAGLVAVEGDSSDVCMTWSSGVCVSWANNGRATDGAVSLGLLAVDAQRVAEHDEDVEANQYHARLLSDRLEGALEMFGGPEPPSFAVTLQTPRNLDEEIVGIKLKEADWADPTLYADLCTQWGP